MKFFITIDKMKRKNKKRLHFLKQMGISSTRKKNYLEILNDQYFKEIGYINIKSKL